MKYLLPRLTSGGNHGHQLKDLLGAFSLATAFDLRWVSGYDPYVDMFGFAHGAIDPSDLPRNAAYLRFRGPRWNGLTPVSLHRFRERVSSTPGDVVISVENAFRLLPHQLAAFEGGDLIPAGCFDKLVQLVTTNYQNHNQLDAPFDSNSLSVAVHIGRSANLGTSPWKRPSSPWEPRWLFGGSYFEEIIRQIQRAAKEPVQIIVFTEKGTDEERLRPIASMGADIRVGRDRERSDQDEVAAIFNAFVQADLLVCSNSSFSAMAGYFRHNKPTIYHPHAHLHGLIPPSFLPTAEDGTLNDDALTSAIDALLKLKSSRAVGSEGA